MDERGGAARLRSDQPIGAVRLPLGFRGGVPLGFQVLIGIGGLLALLIISVVVAVLLITRLSGEQAQLYDRNIPYARATAAAALNAKSIANDERGFLLTSDPAFIEELGGRVTKARVAFAAAGIEATTDAQR